MERELKVKIWKGSLDEIIKKMKEEIKNEAKEN